MLNKVFLIGRVGQDPEVRRTQSGSSVANFSLATNETWKDKATGERRERTDWHKIVAWEGQANFCSQYIHKGMLILVEGSLQSRSWEDRDGNKRTTVEVKARTIRMLEKKGSSGTPSAEADAPSPEEMPPPSDVPF